MPVDHAQMGNAMKFWIVALLAVIAGIYTPASARDATRSLTIKTISFGDLAPQDAVLKQSWNALGMDADERIYVGFTSLRPDGREDFLVFRYDPENSERRYLGSFIDASERANNLAPGEEIPKGHTRIVEINGRMYMASQGFHDFKGAIDTLPIYRGAHLYAYDIASDHFEDVSRHHPGGVIVAHQGIVALSADRTRGLLVGLTHPHGDIVVLDARQGDSAAILPGIPWALGNPVSREIVVTSAGRIYTYRGTEEPVSRNAAHPIWMYNPSTGTLIQTPYTATGGFWNGQTSTRDGRLIYLSTVNGELYRLEVDSGEFTHLGHFLPWQDQTAGARVNWLFGITLSRDERRIYAIPQTNQNWESNLYAYDVMTGQVSVIGALSPAIYTGSHMSDSRGNIYFARFGNGGQWEGQAGLLVIRAPFADAFQ
jgi:hypothetical protein